MEIHVTFANERQVRSELFGAKLPHVRWLQLFIGITCMVMIANLQYGWTLFVNPITQKFHWSRAALQVAFTVFVLFETWLVPVEGYLVDRFGPRLVTLAGGVPVAIAWSINSVAASLWTFYIAPAVGGIGAGAVYGTCVGNALKWFTDRRGLAAGLTAAGFGVGSAFTIGPIATMIGSRGYQAAFLYFGLGQGLVVFLLGWLIAQPGAAELAKLPAPKVSAAAGRRQFTPVEMARTPVFWVMYVMFVMMAAGGLMATARLARIATDLHVAHVPVTFLFWTNAALIFALKLDRILNGLTRPFFGWVSDWLGRENTMFVAFAAEAVGIMLLSRYGQNPVAFVALSGVVFFAWGEIYSLFPSTCADSYGWRYASANAGLLYTAKGTAALLVPSTSTMAAMFGWSTVFKIAAVLNILAALLAIVVLRPLRKRLAITSVEEAAVAAQTPEEAELARHAQ